MGRNGPYASQRLNFTSQFRSCTNELEAVVYDSNLERRQSANNGRGVGLQANTVRRRSWMRAIFEGANAAHELHFLDIADETWMRRLRERNAAGGYPFQVGETDYELFTCYFVRPTPEEGFNVVVHGE